MFKTTASPSAKNILGYSALLLATLLTACTSSKRHDGPPTYFVDETKVHDAVPKVEPLSKYGNMSSYNVFGKRYYVMRSSKHYEEQGIASWYGTQFHSHHTSSGEPYNMLAMTAAHKSLPLPTYVQVTNLANGKQVIVKVNDRGPFAPNRIIDLSYVAAKKLGMLGHGTAHVVVKALDPNDMFDKPNVFVKNSAQPLTNLPTHLKTIHGRSSSLYLQVGAFKDRSHALRLRQRVAGMVGSQVNIHAARRLYCVQVGPIRDLATAQRISARLRAHGLRSDRV